MLLDFFYSKKISLQNIGFELCNVQYVQCTVYNVITSLGTTHKGIQCTLYIKA